MAAANGSNVQDAISGIQQVGFQVCGQKRCNFVGGISVDS